HSGILQPRINRKLARKGHPPPHRQEQYLTTMPRFIPTPLFFFSPSIWKGDSSPILLSTRCHWFTSRVSIVSGRPVGEGKENDLFRSECPAMCRRGKERPESGSSWSASRVRWVSRRRESPSR